MNMISRACSSSFCWNAACASRPSLSIGLFTSSQKCLAKILFAGDSGGEDRDNLPGQFSHEPLSQTRLDRLQRPHPGPQIATQRDPPRLAPSENAPEFDKSDDFIKLIRGRRARRDGVLAPENSSTLVKIDQNWGGMRCETQSDTHREVLREVK